jgi:hypothetical protein
MLRADMVERSVNATLEDGKETLNAVRCDLIADELGSSVIDQFMGKPGQAAIGCELIGMNRRAGFNSLISSWITPLSVASIGIARVRPFRSRIPSTAVLPAAPRPACSFLSACLLTSFPPT